MGYKANSPVKKIWLPLSYGFIEDNQFINLEEFSKRYEKEYGISIYDLVKLNKNSKCILIVGDIACYSIECTDEQSFFDDIVTHNPVNILSNYESGSNSATTTLIVCNADNTGAPYNGYGLMFVIDKDDDFTKDNIKVSLYEL